MEISVGANCWIKINKLEDISTQITLNTVQKTKQRPQLVWLTGLSVGLWTKGSLVQLLIGAHAWVAGQVPSEGAREKQPHIDVSLPLFLTSFSSF